MLNISVADLRKRMREHPGKGGHSRFYYFLEENWEDFKKEFLNKRMSWTFFAQLALEKELFNADGKPPSAECCRQTWNRLKRHKSITCGQERSSTYQQAKSSRTELTQKSRASVMPTTRRQSDANESPDHALGDPCDDFLASEEKEEEDFGPPSLPEVRRN